MEHGLGLDDDEENKDDDDDNTNDNDDKTNDDDIITNDDDQTNDHNDKTNDNDDKTNDDDKTNNDDKTNDDDKTEDEDDYQEKVNEEDDAEEEEQEDDKEEHQETEKKKFEEEEGGQKENEEDEEEDHGKEEDRDLTDANVLITEITGRSSHDNTESETSNAASVDVTPPQEVKTLPQKEKMELKFTDGDLYEFQLSVKEKQILRKLQNEVQEFTKFYNVRLVLPDGDVQEAAFLEGAENRVQMAFLHIQEILTSLKGRDTATSIWKSFLLIRRQRKTTGRKSSRMTIYYVLLMHSKGSPNSLWLSIQRLLLCDVELFHSSRNYH
ncbi:serine/threonine-protein kinase rio2-like [Macrobrachium nipponense]|uniref:serine/threonine-protein kinase rio2-like n=1 Tax=Macrobrachium nipponense TaxID=159736 RepID=UPI0030C85B3E